MKTSDADILFLPGLGGSSPEHWQSRWAARLSTARLVEQRDWLAPRRDVWAATIADAVATAERPVVLVAHALGGVALLHAAPSLPAGKVAGAMLVAPPDAGAVANDATLAAVMEEFHLPRVDPLPFRSLLVASRNDPYAGFAGSEALAAALGARMLDAGDAGHINVDSGHGPWPEGLMSFASFLKGL